MLFVALCLLRRLLFAWRLVTECKQRQRATQALEDTRNRLGKLNNSTWLMPNLVRSVTLELGWTRTKASNMTICQLRQALREHRAALPGPGPSRTVGLSQIRDIRVHEEKAGAQNTTSGTVKKGAASTRRRSRSVISVHEEQADAQNTTSGAVMKGAASAKRRSRSVKRGPPDTDDAQPAGPAERATALRELLGKLPPEEFRIMADVFTLPPEKCQAMADVFALPPGDFRDIAVVLGSRRA